MVTTQYYAQQDTDFSHEGGLIVDLSEIAPRQSKGVQYIFNSDYRLNSPFTRAEELDKVKTARDAFAQPHLLGHFSAPQSLSIPKQDGIRIKPSQSMNIYLPDYYDFALPIVVAALKDAISLYGKKKFEESSVLLVVKNSEVDAKCAQREEFAEWHDHYNGTRYRTDLIYSFHTTLPTQFKHEGKILQPPENAIMRFGGEVSHRSQRNQGVGIQRLWGAVIIEEKEIHRNHAPDNQAHVGAKDKLFEQFKSAARDVLKTDHSVKALSKPQALIDVEGALHLET